MNACRPVDFSSMLKERRTARLANVTVGARQAALTVDVLKYAPHRNNFRL